MKISVVICTWNRALSLARTLRSLTQVDPPLHAEWEVVVVNNHCTDGTDLILEQFCHLLPLKRVFEPTPGHSHARNCGVDAASGDYFIWTDDDVTVGPSWLRLYEAAFERWPDAAIFGGPVIPRFEDPSPDWIKNENQVIFCAFAGIDLGTTIYMFNRTSINLPFGANFALRGLEQRQFRYDTRLGRRPGPSIIGFEETLVLKRILSEGKIGWWLPDTLVNHWIPSSRQTLHYLRAYYRGVGQVLTSSIVKSRSPRNGFTRTRLFLKAVLLEMHFQYHKQVSQPNKWLPALKRASMTWGRALGFDSIGGAEKR